MTLRDGCAYLAAQGGRVAGSAIFSPPYRFTALAILASYLAIRALWAPRRACEILGPIRKKFTSTPRSPSGGAFGSGSISLSGKFITRPNLAGSGSNDPETSPKVSFRAYLRRIPTLNFAR